MTDLSPSAQDVLTAAICNGPELEYRIAAALRTAADIVDDREASRQLDAIAYELEAQ